MTTKLLALSNRNIFQNSLAFQNSFLLIFRYDTAIILFLLGIGQNCKRIFKQFMTLRPNTFWSLSHERQLSLNLDPFFHFDKRHFFAITFLESSAVYLLHFCAARHCSHCWDLKTMADLRKERV